MVSDITYIPTDEDWLYLAGVMELCKDKIIGISMDSRMTKEDLHQQIGISSATMSKISTPKAVSLDVIDKICCALHCQPGDIIEYIPLS